MEQGKEGRTASGATKFNHSKITFAFGIVGEYKVKHYLDFTMNGTV